VRLSLEIQHISIKTYIDFCTNILIKGGVVFVSFEDAIKNTISVIKYISNTFNHKYEYKKLLTQKEVFEVSTKVYIETSKTLPYYKEIYEDFKSKDLSDVYGLYNKLLDRCIMIDKSDWIDWTGSHG
jgi:hypothetical protein